MAGVNKVILLGHLGSDPEVKYLEGDKVVANLSLATSEAYQDRNGNRVEQTEWHDLELWDQQAKIAEKYLKKGNSVYIEAGEKRILIDAGLSGKKLSARMDHIDRSFTGMDAVFATHEHSDHIRGIGPLLRKNEIPSCFFASKSVRAMRIPQLLHRPPLHHTF